MSVHAGGFPLDRVRLEIYQNTGKLTMRQVWNSLSDKPALLLNGPFFSWNTFSATCHMKIRGKVIFAPSPTYTEWGWAWNDGEAPEWCKLPCDKDNYFTNTVVLVNGGPRTDKQLIWHADADGTPAKPRYTSRPGTGQKDTRFMYYINSSCSLPGIRDAMAAGSWEQGMMGDGGGSTMGKTADWEYYSSRRIPYFILVYLADNEPKGEKTMITINAYSLAKNGGTKLSTNFAVKEFACRDGSDTIFISPALVTLLQKIRTHYGRAVIINSGYRTEPYNAKVGGADYSQHKYGTAADITIKGVTPAALAAYVETLMPNTGGIGIYSAFTHVDVREVKARWNG